MAMAAKNFVIGKEEKRLTLNESDLSKSRLCGLFKVSFVFWLKTLTYILV